MAQNIESKATAICGNIMKSNEKSEPSNKGFRILNVDGERIIFLEAPLYISLRDIALVPETEGLEENPKYISKKALIKAACEFYEWKTSYDKSKPISSICEDEINNSSQDYLSKIQFDPDTLKQIIDKAKFLDQFWV